MYDLKWARTAVRRAQETRSGNIRVHPNGFIQLDLLPVEETWQASHHRGHSGADLRLHVWNPPGFDLPRQETHNEIHTHVFDMYSNVVRGKMNQRIYTFAVGSEWFKVRVANDPSIIKEPTTLNPQQFKLYKALYGAKAANSRLEDTGVRGVLVENFDWSIHQGQSYFQPAFTFHDSDPEGCTVTVMEKAEIHEGDAYVLIPGDIEPDNSYDRANAAPADFLWAALEGAIA